MGAKCSKAPESQDDDRFGTAAPAPAPSPSPSRFAKPSFRGRSPEPARHAKRTVGAMSPQPPQGWGLKFADMRSQELAPPSNNNGGHDERSKGEKRKLARALSTKATSVRSITSIVAKKGALKVSGVLRGAGTVGLGALDTFSSSVANLNSRGGFAAATISKGNKIGILAFEVANTIVKGCNLKMTLAEEDIRTLREEVLVSEGVQRLVSNNPDELLLIAAADKRNELKVFTDEVVRFGNHCKDPQWHGYDRVFQRLFKETEIIRLSSVEADKIMDDLMTLAQNTADLYHDLHALDRFRTDLKRKQKEEESAGANARGGETVALLKSEVKSQEKHVEGLKKRSLWSRTLEEIMEQLVDIANFLYQEISDNFGSQVFLEAPEEERKRNAGKLGSSGLALHYANLINQIDSLVQRPGAVPPNTRDNLYQGLPPSVKAALRARLQYTQNWGENGFPLSTTELRGELDKILSWLVPVATNTTKAHHGFGWVGEWANTGSPADRRAMGYVDITLLQTLHHANQQKVENHILELIIGLHHLVSRAKANLNHNNSYNSHNNLGIIGARSPQKSPVRIHVKPAMPEPFLPSDRSVSPPPFGMFTDSMAPPGYNSTLSQEDKEMLLLQHSNTTGMRKLMPGLSKSQEFDTSRSASNREFLKLSKSNSHSQASSTGQQVEAPLYRPRNRIKPLGGNNIIIHSRLDEPLPVCTSE